MWQTFLRAVFMAVREAELDRAGYTVLHGVTDLLIATSSMHGAIGKQDSYPVAKAKELYSFMLEAFSGEEK